MNEENTIFQQTKYGGTTFLDVIPITQGAPLEKPKASELFSIMDQAQKWQWQFRTIMALREHPKHTVAWITLTYAQEPPTWDSARRHITQWLRSVKDYHRRVLLPARTPHDNPNHKPAYIIVEEEGALHGRKHFHVLFLSAYPLPIKQWEEPLLKWKHGFQKVKRIDLNQTIGLAVYIAKYANKSQGKTKCSSHFGLTTITTLLSLSRFHLLFQVNPTLAQKLIRRLCLTPNYPTFRTMTYLASRQTFSASSIPHSPSLHKRTGTMITDLNASKDLNASPSPDNLARTRISQLATPMVRKALHQITACASTDLSRSLIQCLPGLSSFGRPKLATFSTCMEPENNTLIWLTKTHYRHCARNRSSRPKLPME